MNKSLLLAGTAVGPLLINVGRILARSTTREVPPPAQQLLVLGTAQYDGRPSRQLAARLDHALTRAGQLSDATVITVGGSRPGDRFTEAGVGRTYLLDRGVGDWRVIAVPEGADTRSSVAAVLAQSPGAADRKTLVITDPNHAHRATLIARAGGMTAQADPTPSSPTQFPSKSWWLTLSHEVGGLVVVDVSRLLGRGAADRVEEILRQVQGWLRPSRRARHATLRRGRGTTPKRPGADTLI